MQRAGRTVRLLDIIISLTKTHRIRLFDTVAEDAAIEDCLFALRQELHRNNIDFESFAKVCSTTNTKQALNIPSKYVTSVENNSSHELLQIRSNRSNSDNKMNSASSFQLNEGAQLRKSNENLFKIHFLFCHS